MMLPETILLLLLLHSHTYNDIQAGKSLLSSNDEFFILIIVYLVHLYGGRSVGIVRSRTQTMEFSLV
jgi:hypothetical protein